MEKYCKSTIVDGWVAYLAIVVCLVMAPAAGAYDVAKPLYSGAAGSNWGWAHSFITSTAPYDKVGVVLAGGARGSGCAVQRHIVLTCGHVVLDGRGNWLTNIKWDRARTSLSSAPVGPAQSIVSSTYQLRLQEGYAKEQAAAFSQDWAFLAFYGNSAGNGGWVEMAVDYLEALSNAGQRAHFEIVGYPSALYSSSTDKRRDEMHSTNPSMTYSQWYRYASFYYRGEYLLPHWFYTYDLYSEAGNSGGPVLGIINGVKYVSGIFVSGVEGYVKSGARELTRDLYNIIVDYNGRYKEWASTRVAAVRSGSPVKVNQTWGQAFSVGSDGRLQCTFFNGYYWQTYSLGGQILDSGAKAPFDIDPVTGMVFYISGGDVWVAYVGSTGWAHLRVLDYGVGVTGTPVALSYDPTYRLAGVTQSNGTRRLLYFTGYSWASFTTTFPGGRLVSSDAGISIAWDYKSGGGLLGRYFYGGWQNLDVTANLGGVLPGDTSPTATLDGKLARFGGGLAYASNYSTLELLMFWYGYWTRVSLQSGVNSRSWVAADRFRSSIFCVDTSGKLAVMVPGTSNWQKTATSINSTADSSGAVVEAWGTMFHATGTSLSVCALQ